MIQVHIVDDLSGELLADVDASSTADGLAYYLRSRNIVPNATEETVNPSGGFVAKFGKLDTIVFEERGPIVGELIRALHAKAITLDESWDAAWAPSWGVKTPKAVR